MNETTEETDIQPQPILHGPKAVEMISHMTKEQLEAALALLESKGTEDRTVV